MPSEVDELKRIISVNLTEDTRALSGDGIAHTTLS